jgi:hypothetical protein
MPEHSVREMVIDYDYAEKKEIVKNTKMMWCKKPCFVLMKNEKREHVSKS